MQGFFFTVLIALANSLDSLGAWLAFSMKGIRITPKINLWISVMTFVISAASTWLGGILAHVIDPKVCAWISTAVFVSMGAWFILEPLIKRREYKARLGEGNVIIAILEHPEAADLNRSKDIDIGEATLLGIALSINNLGGSLSAGMLGLDPWLIGLFSAAMNFGALWVGKWLSRMLLRLGIAGKAGIVSGAILILIGIKQIL